MHRHAKTHVLGINIIAINQNFDRQIGTSP